MRRAAGLLAATVLAAAVFRFWALGFYNDDYALLAALARAEPDGLLRGFAAEFAKLFWSRPLDILFFPGLYALFGAHPLPYHVMARLLDLACAWQFYRWLKEEGVGDNTALLAGIFVALYPNHDATRLWPSGLVAQTSLAGTLWGLRLFRRRDRAAGCLVFLASMLLYEAPSLLVLTAPLLAWLKDRKSALRTTWPLLAAFTVGAAWQRVIVPLAFAVERHPVSLSPGHAFKVLGTGFECTFANRLAHFIAKGTQFAWGSFSAFDWAVCLLVAGALAVQAKSLAKRYEPPRASPALPLALALFLLGYAPYFFDASYMPTVFSANNRLNMTGALGGALFFAWLSGRWQKRGPVLAGLLAAAFLLTGWTSNAQYAQAYSKQKEILDALEPQLPPDAKMILLYGFPERVGAAVVFESAFDLEGALALRGHRVKARVGQGRMRYEKESAVFVWYGEEKIPYDGLYIYDHATRAMIKSHAN
ncbi:MAG: hypothetical protein HYZ75_12275 [Elusimicrobia bacterium]|nr:hypothetical protein [Elusimicrobiota bacterium]